MAAKAKQRALTAKGMLSHGQKISRGLQSGSELRCTDNTGARVLRLIQAMGYKGRLRRYPSATIGDKVTVSVRQGSPDMRKKIFQATETTYTQYYRMAGSGRFESIADLERNLKANEQWRKR